MSNLNATSSGLDNVMFAETGISDVDGERGRLVIAGSDVEQLAATSTFEEAASRVLAAGGAEHEQVANLRATLAAARAKAWETLPRLGDALEATDGMDALRAALAHLRATRLSTMVGTPSGTGEHGAFDDVRDAIAAIGAAPVFVAAWSRTRAGATPVAPDPYLGHAADYLRMTIGPERAGEVGFDAAARGLDAYLTTVIDHGMNASTFTARVVTSTASDLVSAIVAAVGALKGPPTGLALHRPDARRIIAR